MNVYRQYYKGNLIQQLALKHHHGIERLEKKRDYEGGEVEGLQLAKPAANPLRILHPMQYNFIYP